MLLCSAVLWVFAAHVLANWRDRFLFLISLGFFYFHVFFFFSKLQYDGLSPNIISKLQKLKGSFSKSKQHKCHLKTFWILLYFSCSKTIEKQGILTEYCDCMQLSSSISFSIYVEVPFALLTHSAKNCSLSNDSVIYLLWINVISQCLVWYMCAQSLCPLNKLVLQLSLGADGGSKEEGEGQKRWRWDRVNGKRVF